MNWNLIIKVVCIVTILVVPGSIVISGLYLAVRKQDWFQHLIAVKA